MILLVILASLFVANPIFYKLIGLEYVKKDNKQIYKTVLINIFLIIILLIISKKIIDYFPFLYNLRLPFAISIGYFIMKKVKDLNGFIEMIILYIFFIERLGEEELYFIILDTLICGILLMSLKRAFIGIKNRLEIEDVPYFLKGNLIEIFCLFVVGILFQIFNFL